MHLRVVSNETVHYMEGGSYLLVREFVCGGEDLVEFVSAGVTYVCGDGAVWSAVRGVDEHSG